MNDLIHAGSTASFMERDFGPPDGTQLLSCIHNHLTPAVIADSVGIDQS